MGIRENEDEYYTDYDTDYEDDYYSDYTDSDDDEDTYYEDDNEREEILIHRRLLDLEWYLFLFFNGKTECFK
jgi:hypothetical protein